MISFLKGKLTEKKAPVLVIDVNGIGYELTVSMNTIYDMPEVGKEVFIHTHLIVREDAHTLYGFSNDKERSLFRTLIKVNGVGPKLAITILSSINAQDFVQCVFANDSASLTRLPGIGKKTAERLILDLRDRLKDWQQEGDATQINSVAQLPKASAKQDAISALISLGYKPQEAKKAIEQVANDELNSEELIRQGLKNLVK